MEFKEALAKIKLDLGNEYKKLRIKDIESYGVNSSTARRLLVALRIDKDVECRKAKKASCKSSWEFKAGVKDFSVLDVDFDEGKKEYIVSHIPHTEEGYKISIFAENLKQDFHIVSINSNASLFGVDKYVIKNWLDKLVSYKVAVKSMVDSRYKIVFSEQEYNKAMEEVNTGIENGVIEPMDYKAKGEYITIPEANSIENMSYQIQKLLTQANILIENQIKGYSALHFRDEKNNDDYEACMSLQGCYQKVYNEREQLAEQVKKQKEKVKDLTQHHAKYKEDVEQALDKAVLEADKEFEKYKNIILKVIQTELEDRRVEQIKERFATMRNKIVTAFVSNARSNSDNNII